MPDEIPPIQVRDKAGQKEEEEEKKRGAALLRGGAAADGSALSGTASVGRTAASAAGEAGAAAETGGLASRLLSPFRSIVEFLQKCASLGLVEGSKFALRNVFVQGLLAGLAVMLIAGLFISPGNEATGKAGTGVFASKSGGLAPQETRGNGLFGAIPGIYERVMSKLRGEPPADVTAKGEEAKGQAEEGKTPEAKDPAAEDVVAKAAREAGSASPSTLGKLEKLANLFGSGGGGGGGAGGSSANLPVGGRAGAPGGGAADGKRSAAVGKLDAMKGGRVKVPLTPGRSQGLLNSKDARGQLRNAQLASQLAGKAADGQAGASMASLPFDGQQVPGGSVASSPGGGIGPWTPGGNSTGGGPGPSNLNGGDPTNPDPPPTGPGNPNPNPNPCPSGQTIGTQGKCIPNPCKDGEMADTAGKCVKLSNISPYQADLDEAARLIGQGQGAIDGAGKYKWFAIICFAIAGLIVWSPKLAKGNQDKGADNLTSQVAAKNALQREVDGLQAGKDALTKSGKPELWINQKLLDQKTDELEVAKLKMQGVGAATTAANAGGWMGRIGAAVAIAGIGMAFLNQYNSKMQEGQEALAQAQELADKVKETYGQTDQAGRINSATDTKCTIDGKPKIQNPAACGYKPDMTSEELKNYSKCMTAPVCTPTSSSR